MNPNNPCFRKQTYADQCIERASLASPKPRKANECLIMEPDPNGHDSYRGGCPVSHDCLEYINSLGVAPLQAIFDAQFIAHARTDVEELARRLNVASEAFKGLCELLHKDNAIQLSVYCGTLAKGLEAMPREK